MIDTASILPPTDLTALRYVRARDQWDRRVRGARLWIVLHSMEALELVTTSEGCANYFANPGDRQASTQFVCDVDSTIRCMEWDTRGASAAGMNDEAWHIEQAGFARQSAAEWRDPYSDRMIREQVAPLVAALAIRDGIPLRFVDAAGLSRREPGVTTHHEGYKAFGGDVRTDPGFEYPMNDLLALARLIVHPTATARPPVAAQTRHPGMELWRFPNQPTLFVYGVDRDGEWCKHAVVNKGNKLTVDNPDKQISVEPGFLSRLPTRVLSAGDNELDARFHALTGL